MKTLWTSLVFALAALTIALCPRIARADDEAAKLEAQGGAIRYTVKSVPASSIDMGGAAILVNAPIEAVRKVVTRYNDYAKFLKPFDQSRVLSKRKGVSEVYLQVPILHGAARIWAVADLPAPVKDGAGEKIVARFKRGNVADFRAVWRLRAVDAEHTILKLELLVDPKLPLPSSLITTHLAKSADKGVTAVRDRAQAAVAETVAKRAAAVQAQAAPKTASDIAPTPAPLPAPPPAADAPQKQQDVAQR